MIKEAKEQVKAETTTLDTVILMQPFVPLWHITVKVENVIIIVVEDVLESNDFLTLTIRFQGRPVGIAGENENAQYINNVKAQVAKYYPHQGNGSVPSLTPTISTPIPLSPTPFSIDGFSRKCFLINTRTAQTLDVEGSCNYGTYIHLWDCNNGGAQVFHYHFAALGNCGCQV